LSPTLSFVSVGRVGDTLIIDISMEYIYSLLIYIIIYIGSTYIY